MESKLEKLPDNAIVKYLKYVHNIIGDQTISSPIELMYHPEVKKLFTPIGSYDRLDCEYLFILLEDNPFYFKEGVEINRPQLESRDVTYILKERQWVDYYYNGTIETYMQERLDKDYLETLKSEDEIDPYSWDWESEIVDSDFIDDDWDID